MKVATFVTFQDAFLALNREVMAHGERGESRTGVTKCLHNLSYCVLQSCTYTFDRSDINRIDYEYAKTFFDFMMSGGTNASQPFANYPQASKFTTLKQGSNLPKNFNTFYGPRIVEQIPAVVKELQINKSSRRAVMHILRQSDNVLLDADESLEYPCTLDMCYFFEDDELSVQFNMRSQNAATVMQLDMYVQARLLTFLACSMAVDPGRVYSNIVNAHIFERDFDYVEGLLSIA